MDSQEIQTIFLSFSGYLEGIKNYITALDPVKYKNITESLARLKSTIGELKLDPKAHPFQWLHLARTALDAMTQIFTLMDFKVDWHTGEVSKTTATKFISQWQDITLTYKIYTRDATARVAALVGELAPLVQTMSAQDLQAEFHKYPLADDLYVTIMTQKLDEAYKTNSQTEIINILETDKSHILGERKFVSPYLTLNLHPRHLPESIAQVAARLERKATTLEALAKEIAPLGLLVIYREQPVDFVAKLPARIDAAAGLTESSIQPVLLAVATARTWNWKISIWRRDATAFVCIECVGDYRLLSPWTTHNPVVQRIQIQKVLNSQLGRPAAYYHEQDRGIVLNQHARALGQKDAPASTADLFGLNRGKIVNAMIEALPKKATGDDLESPAIWRAWQRAMLATIETRQISTLLRLMVQLERQFKKDLLGRYKSDAPGDIHIWLETHLSKIFAGVLNKNTDMFGILAQKQNIIDEMSRLKHLAD